MEEWRKEGRKNEIVEGKNERKERKGEKIRMKRRRRMKRGREK